MKNRHNKMFPTYNNHICNNNRKIRKLLETDFQEQIEIYDDKAFDKESGRLLLSYSTYTSVINRVNLAKIPRNALEPARVVGEEFMKSLKFMFDNKIKKINNVAFISDQVHNMVASFLNELISRGWKVKSVEKLISNGYWYGYVDAILKFDNGTLGLLEIKTRSNHKLKDTDIFQIMTYMRISGTTCGVIATINRNDLSIKFHRIWLKDYENKFRNFIDFPLRSWGLTEYELWKKDMSNSPFVKNKEKYSKEN